MRDGRGYFAASRRLLVPVVLAIVLAGCGGDEAVEPTPTSPPVPTPTPAAIEMSEIVWTTEIDPETRQPLDSVERVPNDAPGIIAAIEVLDMAADTTLTATWTIDGAEVPEATMSVTTESALASGWATFQFAREGEHLFPLGELSVTVSADDGSTVSGSVQITVPET